MSWIREEDLSLANVIKVMSINPKAMEAVSALNRVQEEAIATTVSAANHCRY